MPHQFPRRALALLPVLLLAACAQAPAENLPTVAPQATAQTPAEEPLASFADWRRALRLSLIHI